MKKEEDEIKMQQQFNMFNIIFIENVSANVKSQYSKVREQCFNLVRDPIFVFICIILL